MAGFRSHGRSLFQETLNGWTEVEVTMRSDKLLSDVFPSELVINHVHVVARPPGQGAYDIDFALMLLIITSRCTLL